VPQSGWLSGSLADWPAAKGFFDSLVGRVLHEGKQNDGQLTILQHGFLKRFISRTFLRLRFLRNVQKAG
jgi:hypothetical protein